MSAISSSKTHAPSSCARSRSRSSGTRDSEIVSGFEGYWKVSLKVAYQFHRFLFPNQDELQQTAALAAAETMANFGQECALKQVQSVAGKIYRKYAKDCGWIRKYYTAQDGKKKQRWVRPEQSFNDSVQYY